MSSRQVLGTFVTCLDTMMQVQYGHQKLKYQLTGKPSPLAFNYAKKLLGDNFHHFMVGDSPEIDIIGGKANGLKTVLVESGLY